MEIAAAIKNALKENKASFASVQAALEQMDAATAKRTEALKKIPDFAEYVDATARREKARKLVDEKYAAEVMSIVNSIDVRLDKVEQEIYAAKFPMISKGTMIALSERSLGAVEFNSAVLLMANRTDYPTNELELFHKQRRTDLVNGIIELVLLNPHTTVDQKEKRVAFQRMVNKIYQDIGVMNLLKEQLYLQQARVSISTAYATGTTIRPDDMLLYASSDMLASNQFQARLAELAL